MPAQERLVYEPMWRVHGRERRLPTSWFERAAMASQIRNLSLNVRTKHRAANLDFLCTASALLFFLLSACSCAATVLT
jgi:hypothetical protein